MDAVGKKNGQTYLRVFELVDAFVLMEAKGGAKEKFVNYAIAELKKPIVMHSGRCKYSDTGVQGLFNLLRR